MDYFVLCMKFLISADFFHFVLGKRLGPDLLAFQ